MRAAGPHLLNRIDRRAQRWGPSRPAASSATSSARSAWSASSGAPGDRRHVAIPMAHELEPEVERIVRSRRPARFTRSAYSVVALRRSLGRDSSFRLPCLALASARGPPRGAAAARSSSHSRPRASPRAAPGEPLGAGPERRALAEREGGRLSPSPEREQRTRLRHVASMPCVSSRSATRRRRGSNRTAWQRDTIVGSTSPSRSVSSTRWT